MSWQYGLVALVLGALMPLAYAPFDFYPLVFISLSGLFYCWTRLRPGAAFLQGLLFGLAMFGTGVNWVHTSIHVYGHVTFALSVFLTLLFVLVLAVFPALCGYVAVRLRLMLESGQCYSSTRYVVLVLPALWLLFEWVRGWFLTGFPWLHIGYAYIDTPLAGYAPLFGVYGVSLLVAVSSALFVQMLLAQHGMVSGRYLLIIIIIWWVGAGLAKIEWTEALATEMRVSLVQGNIPQEMKWLSEMRGPTLDLYSGLNREHWDSDLIIWPETAIPLFDYQAVEFLDALKAEAILNNTALLVGLVTQEADTGAYYNSMVGVGIDTGQYDKQHLVPFTEYLPFKGVLAGLIGFLDVPMSDFSSGEIDQPPLYLAGQPLGISICFEDVFGEELIRRLPEATLLVNVSNDAWFAGTVAADQHLQIARMRALEGQRELMRVTNTGITAFIGANGKVRAQSPQFNTTVLTLDVRPRSGATPYVTSGNLVVLIVAGLMIISAFVMGTRKTKSSC